jgi:hypothetical protein
MKPSLNTIAYTPIRYLHKKDFILAHPFDFEMYGEMHSDVMTSITEWCMFNGGCPLKKEHTTM